MGILTNILSKKTRPVQKSRNDLIIEELDKVYGAVSNYLESKSTEGLQLKDNDVKMQKGKATTKCISYTKERAIAFTWFSAKSIAPKHRHETSTETILCVTGKAKIKFMPNEGKCYYKELNPGEQLSIKPGLDHVFFFLTHTELIAITIPADPTFPRDE